MARPIPYVRVTARLGADAHTSTVWAVDLGVRKGFRMFKVVSKEGGERDRLIVGRDGSSDWVAILPARMNLTYGELELGE